MDPKDIPLPSFLRSEAEEKPRISRALFRIAAALLKTAFVLAFAYLVASALLPWVAAKYLVGLLDPSTSLAPGLRTALYWAIALAISYVGPLRLLHPKNFHTLAAIGFFAWSVATGVGILRAGLPQFQTGSEYWVMGPRGPIYSTHGGVDPQTGRPYQPLTPEVRGMLDQMLHSDRIRIDPCRSTMFHPWSGEPLAFWIRRGDDIEFYSAPGHDVRTNAWLEPVTPEILNEFESHGGCQAAAVISAKKEK